MKYITQIESVRYDRCEDIQNTIVQDRVGDLIASVSPKIKWETYALVCVYARISAYVRTSSRLV